MSEIPTPFINLQSDYGFKVTFGTVKNKPALLKFLKAVLEPEIHITDVKFHNKEVLPGDEKGKRIVYDVYFTMDIPPEGSQIKRSHVDKSQKSKDVPHHFILEMQNIYEPPFEDRIFYYGSKAVSEQGKSGWNYDLDPVIVMAVTDFDFSHLSKKLIQDFRLRDGETNEVLTEKFRMLFLSLKQVPGSWEDCVTDLERQLFLIKNMESMDKTSQPYVEGGYEELFKAAESSQYVGEAAVLYSQSLSRLRSYKAGLDYASEQSWESGRAEGRAEGLEEAKRGTALRMLKAGFDIKFIASMTELSESQVLELQTGKSES